MLVSKLVAKIKYLFKRKTDILRFFYLDGEQNVSKYFASISVQITAFKMFPFWSVGGG